MKATIGRAEIKDLVAGLNRIINHSSSLPILTAVRFMAAKGRLSAEATDLDQVGRYLFDTADPDGSGEFIIPFHAIKDLAKGQDGETVAFETGKGTDVTVTNTVSGHPVRHALAGLDQGDWPPCGSEIQVQPAEGFLATYRRCAPFASSDEASRRTICSVYIDLSGKGPRNATLVATDGKRLTCCNSLSLPIQAKDGVILPVTKFLCWSGMGSECSIGTTTEKGGTTWFGLQAGSWTYRAKALAGVYPSWHQVMPNKADEVHQFTFTDADVAAMKKLMPALPGDEGVTIIGSADGALKLAGQNKGEKECTVALTGGSKSGGKPCRVLLNRHYLWDALEAGFRRFGFAAGKSPLRADDSGAVTVLMPMSVSEVTPQPTPTEPAPTTQSKPPAAATPPPATNEENKTMTENTTAQPSALDRLQAAYEVAKTKIREANQALADVAVSIKEAAKEDKARRTEVENVRAGLAKLRAIEV